MGEILIPVWFASFVVGLVLGPLAFHAWHWIHTPRETYGKRPAPMPSYYRPTTSAGEGEPPLPKKV